MDKKEILDILNNAKDEMGAVPMRLVRQAFDKLVQPKECTETHACDLISRQQAIDIVVFECGKWTGLAKEISKQLKQLPSAQPEPKEGYWINGKCNLCGEHAPFWAMASTYHESNYCPNCGAKMKGERQK